MKRSLLLTALMSVAVLTSGCLATLDGKFENRVSCTVAKDKAFVVSEYGPVGIASKIADKDKDVICK
jgi:hypothetical protein